MDKVPVLEFDPASSKEPVLEYIPVKSKEPVLLSKPADKCWCFSFRFWKQREYFGLDSSKPSWFVSLLDRLKELSGKRIDSFLSDLSAHSAWRYHKIDWNQKNIPVQRKDLGWVDAAYRDNEDDYPLLQFQISQALGRVVGFWDENSVFNIVLLDPLHNIQPAKDYGYRVDSCGPLSCDYSNLLSQIDALKGKSLCTEACGYKKQLQNIPTNMNGSNVVMHFLSDDEKVEVDSVINDESTYKDLLLLAAQELKS
ncbi:MAG: hypothetical protein ABW116_13580 [Candidatus Sedimenticola sp. 20ELBAFRAG]